MRAPVKFRKKSKPPAPDIPKRVGKVRFEPLEVATASGQRRFLGVARDYPSRTLAATMWANGHSGLHVTPEVEQQDCRNWSDFLANFASEGHPVHRLAWRTQTFIGDQFKPERLAETIRHGANLAREHPPNYELMLRLNGQMGEAAIIQRATFTISVHIPSLGREIKQLGGADQVLAKQVRDFHTQAMGMKAGRSPIDLISLRPHTYNDLLLENLLALDPVEGQELWQQWTGLTGAGKLLDESVAWPMSTDITSDYARFGRTTHIGYCVYQFPRNGMFSDRFWSIIDLKIPKTVAVVCEMVPHHKAEGFAELSTNAVQASNTDQARSGRRVTYRQDVTAERIAQQERELAEYVGEVGRVRAYIDLTGASLEEVQANARTLRAACLENGILVRELTMRHHAAAFAAMPLARGLDKIKPTFFG